MYYTKPLQLVGLLLWDFFVNVVLCKIGIEERRELKRLTCTINYDAKKRSTSRGRNKWMASNLIL